MLLLPGVMRKHAVLLRKHATQTLGQRENLHLFCLFYQDEIRWRRRERAAIPIDVPLYYGGC
jgi:hypothetical protein